MAPRTERSASRLFGRGFSRVASVGIKISLYIRLIFACFYHRFRRRASEEFLHRGTGRSPAPSDAALCAEAAPASIRQLWIASEISAKLSIAECRKNTAPKKLG